MDRPVLCLKYLGLGVFLIGLEVPEGESRGLFEVERGVLLDEIAFPRSEPSAWVRIPLSRPRNADMPAEPK